MGQQSQKPQQPHDQQQPGQKQRQQ